MKNWYVNTDCRLLEEVVFNIGINNYTEKDNCNSDNNYCHLLKQIRKKRHKTCIISMLRHMKYIQCSEIKNRCDIFEPKGE